MAQIKTKGIANEVISGQTALAEAPADTDEFLVSDGGTIKRLDYTHIKSTAVTRPNAKPLVINGDMAVAQRSTSVASITTAGYHTVDRWKTGIVTAGTWTQTQEALTADEAYEDGFSTALKMDCTTADASLAAADYLRLQTIWEGQDLQLLKIGSSTAEKMTVSFWVKATKTGTNIVNLYEETANRQCSQSYTIDSTNTWEKKVLNFPADTGGGIDDDNTASLMLTFFVAAGTNYTSGTLATTWASSSNVNRAVGQVNNADSTSNNFHITGVQLEVGEYTSSTIPPFQHESYGDNLARCQRYFTMYAEGGQAPVGNGLFWEAGEVFINCHLPTTMRLEPPTIYQTTGTDYFFLYRNGGADGITQLTLNASSSHNCVSIYLNAGTNGLASDTKNRPCILRAGSASAKFGLDAEL